MPRVKTKKKSAQERQTRAWKARLMKKSPPPCPKRIILRIKPPHSIIVDGVECHGTLHYTERSAVIQLEHCRDFRRMFDDLLHEWGHLMRYPSLEEDEAFDIAHGDLRRKYLYSVEPHAINRASKNG